jgi:hypothetical protein
MQGIGQSMCHGSIDAILMDLRPDMHLLVAKNSIGPKYLTNQWLLSKIVYKNTMIKCTILSWKLHLHASYASQGCYHFVDILVKNFEPKWTVSTGPLHVQMQENGKPFLSTCKLIIRCITDTTRLLPVHQHKATINVKAVIKYLLSANIIIP